MSINAKEIRQRLKRFEEACKEAGVKLTHQRMEIFRDVVQSGDHPDAEMVFRRVSRRMPRISLDTVYRTLWLLDDLGLITTLGSSRGRTRFDANMSRHHHFVCQQCGLTRDFYSEAFDSLALPESINTIGHVEMTHVEVRGICHECAKKQESKPNRIEKKGD